MGVGNNQASIAAQKEAIRPELSELMLLTSVFWSRIKTRTDITPVGSRPTRVPTQPISGGKFRVFGADGQDMGRGSGPQEVPGYLSCASYLQASEYTAQSNYATDSSQKAVKNYVTLTHEQAAETLGGYLDVLAQMDGSNTIDTIVSVVTGGLVVNNANFFQSNQTVDVWTAVGGSFVTSLEIEIEDVNNQTLWMTTAIPGTVVAGYVLMVNGATGQSNSGFFGTRYYGVGTNTGNFMGIPRASYPGRYSAQNIDMGGMSLTPQAVRATQVKIIRALGAKVQGATDPVAHCGPDMQLAWENLSLTVQSIIRNQQKGDNSEDMLAKSMSPTMAGREILMNPRAIPGRIDFMDFGDLWRIETKSADYYDVGGQTEFPVIGNSGGLASSTLFYMVLQAQLGIGNSRKWSVLSNVSIPQFLR